ncbi:MAG: His-Xaa-Ser system radical SAM maturase HxsB [Emcibacteraceae bacterium]|nr:His-Xaa-Ser system radical SAM maturase HxsB [Emcibacteraceae bacterium]
MSKFLDFNHFLNDEENYKLLPFNFRELPSKKYLLTTISGEWHQLSFEKMESLIDGNLKSDDKDFQWLESKSFLYRENSKANVSLAALKLRTKFSHIFNLTQLHIFVVTLRCEHSCPYCQVSRQNDDSSDEYDMSEETALSALDIVFQSPSDTLKIEFQGGESLLNFELIKFIVEHANEKAKQMSKYVEFVIATNLAPLTDEHINYCRLNNIQISTSLDGPRDVHNANRPKRGNNSYELAVDGIKRVRESIGVDYISALMTTTKSSIKHFRIIIDEYIDQGFQGIFLRPLSPYGFAVKTKWIDGYDVSEWMEAYKDGLEYILELNKNGFKFTEFYSSLLLKRMFSPFSTGHVDLMHPSGAGLSGLVYNYDGTVFASDEGRMLAEMGKSNFELGNVADNDFSSLISSEPLVEALSESFGYVLPSCIDCAFLPFCGSDPVYHFATQNSFGGLKAYSDFCNRHTALFEHLFSLLDDPEVRPILMEWVKA